MGVTVGLRGRRWEIESGRREIPYDNTGIRCNYTPDEPFLSTYAHQVRHLRHQHEELLINNVRNTQDEICYQKQEHNAAQHQPNMSASTSRTLTKSRKPYLRQKATNTNHVRGCFFLT